MKEGCLIEEILRIGKRRLKNIGECGKGREKDVTKKIKKVDVRGRL